MMISQSKFISHLTISDAREERSQEDTIATTNSIVTNKSIGAGVVDEIRRWF